MTEPATPVGHDVADPHGSPGGRSAAARGGRQRGRSPEVDPGYPHEQEYLLLAWVRVPGDHPGQALALLERLLTLAAAQDRAGRVIEIGALGAMAARGHQPAAEATVAEPATVDGPHGYVRAVTRPRPSVGARHCPPATAHRPGPLSPAAVPRGGLPHPGRAPGRQPAGPGEWPAVPGLAEPLTSRELEILAMLVAGMPNQAIAEDLFVTVFTVKKHVSHVLRKLGAANRTQAAARARDLGLIPRRGFSVTNGRKEIFETYL